MNLKRRCSISESAGRGDEGCEGVGDVFVLRFFEVDSVFLGAVNLADGVVLVALAVDFGVAL